MESGSRRVRGLQASLKETDVMIGEAMTEIDTILDTVNTAIDQLAKRHDIAIQPTKNGVRDSQPNSNSDAQPCGGGGGGGAEESLEVTLQKHVSRRESVLLRAQQLNESLHFTVDSVFQLAGRGKAAVVNQNTGLSTDSCSCASQDAASLPSMDNALSPSPMADRTPPVEETTRDPNSCLEGVSLDLHLASKVEGSRPRSPENDVLEAACGLRPPEVIVQVVTCDRDGSATLVKKMDTEIGCPSSGDQHRFCNQSSAAVGDDISVLPCLKHTEETATKCISSRSDRVDSTRHSSETGDTEGKDGLMMESRMDAPFADSKGNRARRLSIEN